MGDILLEAKDLHYSYSQGEEALHGVSFSLRKGEYLSLLGHNGSGKSTLAKLLSGLLETKKGEIWILGEKLDRESYPRLRKNIGMIFQNPDNQFVASSVEEDIAFGLENMALPREEMVERVGRYARAVGMEEFLNRAPENLSGGQKQRVALAGVLAMEPKVIILDEATSMLDPKGKREIYSVIAIMRESNPDLSLISITHDVEEASYSDRIIVLNRGEIAMEGTPMEVFSNEERLKELRLYPPFSYRLAASLKKKGYKVNPGLGPDKMLEGVWSK